MPGLSLPQRLKIKEGSSVAIINPPAGYLKFFSPLPANVNIYSELNNEFDSIQLFVTNKSELEENIAAAKKALKKNGTLWICYPKKTSKILSDLDRNASWEVVFNYGLHGIASAAINETWTALGLKHGNEASKTTSQKKDETEIDKFIDSKKRIIKLPVDFRKELGANKGALDFFNGLSFTNRKEYVVWIITAKREKTRKERILKSVEKLKSGKKNPTMK